MKRNPVIPSAATSSSSSSAGAVESQHSTIVAAATASAKVAIPDSKLVTFTVGQQKKSRFQKAREEKELKRKQDEEEAAKVYESFVSSFVRDDDDGKTFVRGGMSTQSAEGAAAETEGKRGDVYRLESKGKPVSEMDRLMNEIMEREKDRVVPAIAGPSSMSGNLANHRSRGSKGGRQIDDFLSEIKSLQEARDREYGGVSNSQSAAGSSGGIGSLSTPAPAMDDGLYGLEKGSFDTGDPNTTNLYVGNLAPSTTEEHLIELFGKYGDINSVKVMWPRTEEEKARKRNCGFVSFMRRRDAEDALIELQDYCLADYKMIVGWGKAVKLNTVPVFSSISASSRVNNSEVVDDDGVPLDSLVPPDEEPLVSAPHLPTLSVSPAVQSQSGNSDVPVPLSRSIAQTSIGNVVPTMHLANSNGLSAITPIQLPMQLPPPRPPSLQPPNLGVVVHQSNFQVPIMAPPPPPPLLPPVTIPPPTSVQIQIPSDPQRKAMIDLVARYSATDGEAFEKALKLRESENLTFSFLREIDSPDGQYYRWRTYAFVWGDDTSKWNTSAVQWSPEGQVIVPPSVPEEPTLADVHSKRRRSASPHRGSAREQDRSFSRKRSRSRSPYDRRQRRDRTESFGRRDEASYGRRGRSRSRSCSRSRSRSPHRGNSSRVDPFDSRGRDSDRVRSRRDRENDDRERSKYAGLTGAQIERIKAQKRSEELARLSKEDYQEWKRKLQTLSLSRESIKQAMGFAFDKIESAEEIVTMIKDRLILPASYAAVKIAGLYLMSDILHNSGAPIKHAVAYRGLVQAVLPEVIENISACYRNTGGRMTAFNIEERIKNLFKVWAEWSVFPSLYLIGLQATFYTSDSDYNAMQLFIKEQMEIAEIDGVSMTESSSNELEAVRKRAKLCGIPFKQNTSMFEIQFKLEHAERYFRLRYGTTEIASISTLLAPKLEGDQRTEQSGSEDDIDGIPIGSESVLAGLVASTTVVRSTTPEGADEDIDGVPMSLGQYSMTISRDNPF